MTVWVFDARLLHSFRDHGNFWYQIFSQGSVPTYARFGGIFTLLQNFLKNLPVTKEDKKHTEKTQWNGRSRLVVLKHVMNPWYHSL